MKEETNKILQLYGAEAHRVRDSSENSANNGDHNQSLQTSTSQHAQKPQIQLRDGMTVTSGRDSGDLTREQLEQMVIEDEIARKHAVSLATKRKEAYIVPNETTRANASENSGSANGCNGGGRSNLFRKESGDESKLGNRSLESGGDKLTDMTTNTIQSYDNGSLNSDPSSTSSPSAQSPSSVGISGVISPTTNNGTESITSSAHTSPRDAGQTTSTATSTASSSHDTSGDAGNIGTGCGIGDEEDSPSDLASEKPSALLRKLSSFGESVKSNLKRFAKKVLDKDEKSDEVNNRSKNYNRSDIIKSHGGDWRDHYSNDDGDAHGESEDVNLLHNTVGANRGRNDENEAKERKTRQSKGDKKKNADEDIKDDNEYGDKYDVDAIRRWDGYMTPKRRPISQPSELDDVNTPMNRSYALDLTGADTAYLQHMLESGGEQGRQAGREEGIRGLPHVLMRTNRTGMAGNGTHSNTGASDVDSNGPEGLHEVTLQSSSTSSNSQPVVKDRIRRSGANDL